MRPIKYIVLTTITAGCAPLLHSCAGTQTSTQNRESMLVASGFKVITPKTAAQQQKLQNLPPGKVTMIQKGKKTYYIFPDPVQNKAYVGGPNQYQQYQQLRADNRLAMESLETAETYHDAEMQWSLWDVWGVGFGSFGPMGGPGPY